MPYTSIMPVRSMAARSEYLKYKRGKTRERLIAEGKTRILACAGDVSLDEAVRLGRSINVGYGRRNEAYEIVVSFGDELPPGLASSWEACAEYGHTLGKRTFPNSTVVVTVHEGEDGHRVHAHIDVLNHDSVTGGAISPHTRYWRVREESDKLAREWGFPVIGEKSMDGWESKREDAGVDSFERALGDKVQEALDASCDMTSFDVELALRGVELIEQFEFEKDPATDEKTYVVDERGKPKVKGLSYKMEDESGRPRRRRASTLCQAFTLPAVTALFAQVQREWEEEREREIERLIFMRENRPKAVTEMYGDYAPTVAVGRARRL